MKLYKEGKVDNYLFRAWQDLIKQQQRMPCNEERSERSERDFTVEKSMGEVWPFLR